MRINYKILVYSLVLVLLNSCDTDSSSYKMDGVYSYTEEAYNENYEDYGENPFFLTSETPVSTFSVDADGGSYTNSRRFLSLSQNPPEAAVRVEEFINFFPFDYDEPINAENVSVNSELATCPWNEEHYLLRLGLKGKTIPENELKAANYVFLIDVSGSMNSEEKLGLLKVGFKRMVDELSDLDHVAIVTYAGQAGLLLESTAGDQKDKIRDAIESLGAGGSTAGAQGIITAYEIAQENFIPNGNNRVILGSDGDFNVGPSSRDELVELIEAKRDFGIYLTVLGVGSGNLNDQMMEQIANNGNGNYEYIDSVDQIEKVFVEEKSKFYTVAKDVKLQLTFNPDQVVAYRLIGYENRALENEDFEDDEKDAGEIGAGQTITALYELELKPDVALTQAAAFEIRYKKPGESASELITHPIVGSYKSIAQASDNMRFAASITSLGLLLKNSEYKGSANKQMVIDLGESALTYDPFNYRKEYIEMIKNWNP